MFFLGDVPGEVDSLLHRQQELGYKLLQAYDGPIQTCQYDHDVALYENIDAHFIGRIQVGLVHISTADVEVLCFEAGDIFSLPRVFGLPHGEAQAQAGCIIELIHRDDFVQHVYGDIVHQHTWSNYLLTVLAIYQRVLAYHHLKSSVQPPKGFESVAPGETIIREGEEANTVYQMMSGSAEVSIQGVKVGEVLEGEIFGAMAVFSGDARNATVTAREACSLLSIPKGKFIDLIRNRPETAMTLLENMSRRIHSLNQQVLAQQGARQCEQRGDATMI